MVDLVGELFQGNVFHSSSLSGTEKSRATRDQIFKNTQLKYLEFVSARGSHLSPEILHHQPRQQLGLDLSVSALFRWTFPALCPQKNSTINPHTSGVGYTRVTCQNTSVLTRNLEIIWLRPFFRPPSVLTPSIHPYPLPCII